MAVLFEERFSLDSGKIDFPIHIATLSIKCLKVSQVDFPNQCVLQSLNIVFSANPGEMHQTTLTGVSSIQKIYSPLSDKFIIIKVMPLGLKPVRLEP